MEYTTGYFLNGFDNYKQRAVGLLERPDRILKERPDPKTWSVLECLEHLNRTGRQYLRQSRKTLEHTPLIKTTTYPVYRPRFWMRWFIGWILPPYRFGYVKAPKLFQPQHVDQLERHATINRFLDLQDDYLQLLEDYKQYRLDTVSFSSPITPLLKMNTAETLALTLAHQKRHFWQIEQILKTIDQRTDTTKNN